MPRFVALGEGKPAAAAPKPAVAPNEAQKQEARRLKALYTLLDTELTALAAVALPATDPDRAKIGAARAALTALDKEYGTPQHRGLSDELNKVNTSVKALKNRIYVTKEIAPATKAEIATVSAAAAAAAAAAEAAKPVVAYHVAAKPLFTAQAPKMTPYERAKKLEAEKAMKEASAGKVQSAAERASQAMRKEIDAGHPTPDVYYRKMSLIEYNKIGTMGWDRYIDDLFKDNNNWRWSMTTTKGHSAHFSNENHADDDSKVTVQYTFWAGFSKSLEPHLAAHHQTGMQHDQNKVTVSRELMTLAGSVSTGDDVTNVIKANMHHNLEVPAGCKDLFKESGGKKEAAGQKTRKVKVIKL